MASRMLTESEVRTLLSALSRDVKQAQEVSDSTYQPAGAAEVLELVEAISSAGAVVLVEKPIALLAREGHG